MKLSNLITKRDKKGIPLKGFILEVVDEIPIMIAFEEECIDIYFFNKEKEMFGIVIDLKELDENKVHFYSIVKMIEESIKQSAELIENDFDETKSKRKNLTVGELEYKPS